MKCTQITPSTHRKETKFNKTKVDNESKTHNRDADSQPLTSPPFRTLKSSSLACGERLEEFMFLLNALCLKLNVPEVAEQLFMEFDLEAGGGLKIWFNAYGSDYGNVVLRSRMPSGIDAIADTILHTLEGTFGSIVAFDNADKAVLWTSNLALRLCWLDQFWSADEISNALRNHN